MHFFEAFKNLWHCNFVHDDRMKMTSLDTGCHSFIVATVFLIYNAWSWYWFWYLILSSESQDIKSPQMNKLYNYCSFLKNDSELIADKKLLKPNDIHTKIYRFTWSKNFLISSSDCFKLLIRRKVQWKNKPRIVINEIRARVTRASRYGDMVETCIGHRSLTLPKSWC